MTNLHDARVEAAAKAMYGRDLDRSKNAYPDRPSFWAKERPAYTEHAALALSAADAVVTVEMIADTAHKAMQESWTDSEEYEHAPAYIARAVLALIRGGEEQC